VRERAGCEENIDLIKSWIKDCEENHSECPSRPRSDDLPELPARVIDVGSDDGSESRFFQSHAVHGAWITLSYCWGKIPFLMLKENVEEFVQGIPMKSMPRTFQVAIDLTRHSD
jgi:hypothetical protein